MGLFHCPHRWLQEQMYLWLHWGDKVDTCDSSESGYFWKETYERDSNIYIGAADIDDRRDKSIRPKVVTHYLENQDTRST